MLSDTELARMRLDLEAMLPDTCNILSATYVNSGGVLTETWGTVTASVACRLDHKRGYEQVQGGAIQPVSHWMLTLPYDTSITAANRVEIGADTWSVQSVDSGKSWAICLRAEVAKL